MLGSPPLGLSPNLSGLQAGGRADGLWSDLHGAGVVGRPSDTTLPALGSKTAGYQCRGAVAGVAPRPNGAQWGGASPRRTLAARARSRHQTHSMRPLLVLACSRSPSLFGPSRDWRIVWAFSPNRPLDAQRAWPTTFQV